MTRGGRLFIILGVILGLLTMVAAVWLISQQSAQPADVPAEAQMTTAVIALQNIEAKTEIPTEAIGTKEIPVSTMPENPIVSPGAVVGRLAGQDILQGEIISKDMIVYKSQIAESGLNASMGVPPGMVAVSFRIGDSSRRVEGAIQNGDRLFRFALSDKDSRHDGVFVFPLVAKAVVGCQARRLCPSHCIG